MSDTLATLSLTSAASSSTAGPSPWKMFSLFHVRTIRSHHFKFGAPHGLLISYAQKRSSRVSWFT